MSLGVTETFWIVCNVTRQEVTNLKTKEEFSLFSAEWSRVVLVKLLYVLHQTCSFQDGYCLLEVNKVITTIMQ